MNKEESLTTPSSHSVEVDTVDMPQESAWEAERDKEKELRNYTKQMQRAHEMYGVPLNLNERVEHTQQALGLEPISPTGDWPLPLTPELGAVKRMNAQDWPGGASPVMVAHEGMIALAKFRHSRPIVENGNEVGGLRREYDITAAFREAGARVVRPLAYYAAYPDGSEPDNATRLETLVVEAVHPDKASVVRPEDWTPEIVRLAIRDMVTFEIPKAEMPLFKDDKRAIVYERDLKDSIVPRLQNQVYIRTLGLIEEAYRPQLEKEVIVHGDCWPNNTLVDKDGQGVQLVDLELAGPGYKGQDAGRMLWGLTINSNWNLSEIGDNANAFIDEWCKAEEDKVALCFGILFESLRWIRDRQKTIDDSKTDEATKISAESEINDIQKHAVEIIERIASRAQ